MHGPASIILASLLLPNGRCCCSLNCAATLLFLSSCSAAMAVLLICFWDAGSEMCAAGLHTDTCLDNATDSEHSTADACCCAAAVLFLSSCSAVWGCWLPCQLHSLLCGHTWQGSLTAAANTPALLLALLCHCPGCLRRMLGDLGLGCVYGSGGGRTGGV